MPKIAQGRCGFRVREVEGFVVDKNPLKVNPLYPSIFIAMLALEHRRGGYGIRATPAQDVFQSLKRELLPC